MLTGQQTAHAALDPRTTLRRALALSHRWVHVGYATMDFPELETNTQREGKPDDCPDCRSLSCDLQEGDLLLVASC